MIKKITLLNHKNRQKFDPEYRDYVLFSKTMLIIAIIWILSFFYAQVIQLDLFNSFSNNDSIANFKYFYYLLFSHAFLLTGIVIIGLKQYSNEDYFWKVSKYKKYMGYFKSFTPSYIIFVIILILAREYNFFTISFYLVMVSLGNLLVLNLRIIIINKVLFISSVLVLYILFSILNKFDYFALNEHLKYLNWVNVMLFTSLLVSTYLTYINFFTKGLNTNIKFKYTKKYKSNLNVYFLNILRSAKIVQTSFFIIFSVAINTYILKNKVELKLFSTTYDYIIQFTTLFLMSNIAFKLTLNEKFKKYFIPNVLWHKVITFNLTSVIFFIVFLIANNMDFSMFIKNAQDTLYIYDAMMVITSIMLGSQIGTLIIKKRSKFSSLIVFIISIMPSSIVLLFNSNKILYVIISLAYLVVANLIVVWKERNEKIKF